MLNIVYFGTPQFAVMPLNALINAGHKISAVISQPDREKNRKGELLPSPVKLFAQKNGLEIFQFEKLRREGVCTLKELKADIFITAAYGQILSQEILDIPKYGTFNIHASLLPKYRGAAPVQWALINGETITGVTIMRTDIGIDTGDIILQKPIKIMPSENTQELLYKLSILGSEAVLQALNMLENNTISYTKQQENLSSHYPMIRKVDGELDFSKSAEEIKNRIRGLNPNPGCYTFLDDVMLKVHRAEVIENDTINRSFGEVVFSDVKKGLFVLCGKGNLRLSEIQPAGGKKMADTEFLRGRSIPAGSVFMPKL